MILEALKASLWNAARYETEDRSVALYGMSKDGAYTLFRAEDMMAWIIFSCAFVVLIIFDNFVLHRKQESLTVASASAFTFFWVLCASGFNTYIYMSRGSGPAFDWLSGYLLEWMLSFDNLFVFHLIFQTYQTPDHLKHKPLFWGICGAVFFRLVFLFIGEYMMHTMYFAHFLFGAFLIYTGAKAVLVDEEDEDPADNAALKWLVRHVRFINYYDKQGNFFCSVPVDANGDVALSDEELNARFIKGSNGSSEREVLDTESGNYGTVRGSTDVVRHETRATLLFLVVCCLELSDILFAVDSVSAIVAQVSDLYLAYTAAVFAMLGLRATFFIIDVLVKLFSLLKYGVGAVLVFIGLKLILSKVVHIPPMIVCAILFATLGSSMVASVIKEKYWPEEEEEEEKQEAN